MTKTSETLMKLTSEELGRRIIDAVRAGASMEDMAHLQPNPIEKPLDAINALKDGNARFFSGQSGQSETGVNARRALIMSQSPYAAILACSDSRVPVEIIFDQGLGHLFVVRNAGNVIGEAGLGTLEYAVKHLDVHLLMVLGHEACGAVTSAMLPPHELEQEPPALRKLIERIQPSVQNLPPIRDRKARMREAVLNNVRYQVHLLRQQPIVRDAEQSGKLQVIGGFYEIGSGAVEFLIEDEDLHL